MTKKQKLKLSQPNLEVAPEIEEELVETPRKVNKWWIILPILIISGLLFVSYQVWTYANAFLSASNADPHELYSSVKSGLSEDFFNQQSSQNILFLGIDQVGENRDKSLLTDTIILINVQADGLIKMIAIPRDLWIDSLKTKINALYYYGEQSPNIGGEKLIKSTMFDISGQQMDHLLLVDLNTVKDVIDVVGGLEITVEHAFTDNEFPRDDVPKDILPISARYKTISFEKGVQHIDGNRALEYIRSRKSADEAENTDQARSLRQKQIIMALLSKMSSKEVVGNPNVLGKLYATWHQKIKTSISDQTIAGFARSMWDKSIKLETVSIPIKTSDAQGVIYNPPIKKHNQWVYEPVDPTWQEFKQFIHVQFSKK